MADRMLVSFEQAVARRIIGVLQTKYGRAPLILVHHHTTRISDVIVAEIVLTLLIDCPIALHQVTILVSGSSCRSTISLQGAHALDRAVCNAAFRALTPRALYLHVACGRLNHVCGADGDHVTAIAHVSEARDAGITVRPVLNLRLRIPMLGSFRLNCDIPALLLIFKFVVQIIDLLLQRLFSLQVLSINFLKATDLDVLLFDLVVQF